MYAEAAETLNTAIATLAKEYGPPEKHARGEHQDIPRCGVMEYAFWYTGQRRLYAALLHEDTELPIELIQGTLPPIKSAKSSRTPAAARKKPAGSVKKKAAAPKKKTR